MEEFIRENLETFGPAAVFVLLMLSGLGLPVGEDSVIITAGVLVGQDQMPFWPTLLCAYFGVCLSDSLWFRICSLYGAPLLHRKWIKRMIHPRRLLEAKHQIEQRGVWVVVMARFIPGGRTPVITMAGLLQLPYWQFALATFSCVLITSPMQLGLGVLIAIGLGTRGLAQTLLVVIMVIVLIPAVSFGLRWIILLRRHKGPLPRAKAAWLKRFRVPRIRSRLRAKKGGDQTEAMDDPAAKPTPTSPDKPDGSRQGDPGSDEPPR